MYAYFKGIVTELCEDSLVLECNNIGYNIKVPTSVLSALSGIGQEIKIYTYTCVREDAFILYGFLTKDDINIFKQLITVNGIGPKGALGILSVLGADELRFAILAGDSKTIAKAPGIGAKSAQRIILELKNKIDISIGDEKQEVSNVSVPSNQSQKNEALEAMVALGYSATEALKAINLIQVTDSMDAGMILKLALKEIVRL